jgi:ornithine--oxo-acid transaminase
MIKTDPHLYRFVGFHLTSRNERLWIGLELTTAARPYCEALMKEGILCKETHNTVIRFAPPLVITKEEIDWAVERIAKVLAK